MAEGDLPKGGNVGNFLQKTTAGLPNWAWILVVGAGIAAAIIIPKFIGKQGTTSPTTGDMSGLGLAIDPTTGFPYAVEGLVPGGGNAGNTTATTTTTPTTTATNTPPTFPFTAMTRTQAGINAINVQSNPVAGGTIIRTVSPGSQVTVTGPAVTDVNNVSFFPIQGGGYIYYGDLVANPNYINWPYAQQTITG